MQTSPSKGLLHIVGTGPGSPLCLTQEAILALRSSACICGYPRYLALLPKELTTNKILVSSGMRHEEERCQKAIDLACQGKEVSLVSSGDAGIYALASLTFELLECAGLLEELPCHVIAGVPALCAAAALLGAPLSHDFACVSLSDLLTPWMTIEKRLHAVFEADFVVVLYNPKSRGRPHYLARAIEIAKHYRRDSCPVGIVRQAYREEESVSLFSLENFDSNIADMLSIIIIGNSQSRRIHNKMLTPRGYHIRSEK